MTDRVDITIKRRDKKPSSAIRVPRILNKRHDQSGPLSRRKKAGGAIVFYDLGYRRSGSTWQTIPYNQVTPEIDFEPTTFLVDELSTGDFNSIRDYILGVDKSQFDLEFKKIDQAVSRKYSPQLIATKTDMSYDAGLIDEIDSWDTEGGLEWTDKGLVAPQALLDRGLGFSNGYITNPHTSYQENVEAVNWFVASNSKGRALWLKEDPTQKITAVASYDAPAVTFTPSPSMTVYLVPAHALSEGLSEVVAPDVYRGQLNYFYLVQPREWALDSLSPYYQAYGGVTLYPYTTSMGVYQRIVDAVIAHQSLPGSRSYYNISTPDWYAGFPYEATNHGGYPQQEFLGCYFSAPSYDRGGPQNGLLKAIIKKGGAYYYVWTDGYV